MVLDDEDFRRANVEASRTIDIQTFVDGDAIAPYYFDTPYFLVPDKNGERVHSLLREALEQSKKLAVATFVLRSRQHVAALIQPHPEMALKLVDEMSEQWKPEVFTDTYRDEKSLAHKVATGANAARTSSASTAPRRA